MIKSITRSLIIFKKPRKKKSNFFDNYIFVHNFQRTLSTCYNNATITEKVAMVTYIKYVREVTFLYICSVKTKIDAN